MTKKKYLIIDFFCEISDKAFIRSRKELIIMYNIYCARNRNYIRSFIHLYN